MEMEGKIWKDGRFWLVEVPALDAMTQGKTRKEALAMVKDLVFEMARSYFGDEIGKDFSITVIDYKKNVIGITAHDSKLLLALSLRRQREKSGSIPKMTQKLVFGCVGYAAHFLSSLAPCACTMVARSRQKICAAALPNSQLLNHFRYTVREASERLGSKSPNAYAQYERGKTSISVDKYEKLLIAANPSERLRLRIV